MEELDYGEAILEGFEYLLEHHDNVFVMGQGLWSPWYVGNTMRDLEKNFGKNRVIDTPVSELACTGAAVGASLCGYRPIVVHPRMDFMLYAMDPIVNQAAKWSHMFGGQSHPAVTIRGIINRGGEQGAQHSQALHSWFAHVPGLRVVMPATVADARDLLIGAVLSDDPVLYIDDRWLYDRRAELPPVGPVDLASQSPLLMCSGSDVTLVGSSQATRLCEEAAAVLHADGISCAVVDLRVVNPLDCTLVCESVSQTGKLCVVDGGWSSCGLGSEIIAQVAESGVGMDAPPIRLTLPATPAPTSKTLEASYYTQASDIVEKVKALCGG